VRNWERQRRLESVRTPGNHRHYRREDVERLAGQPRGRKRQGHRPGARLQ
jgi:DNA-binding transcriptional MerR regulator